MKETQSNKQVYTKSASQSNILKFITQKNSQKRVQGIKCFPNKLFGVSQQSPQHFRGKNTLIDKQTHLSSKQTKQPKVNAFNLKNYFSVAHCQGTHKNINPEQNNFKQDFCKTYRQNQSSFHRTISPNTQFYNKHAWVGTIQYVMGHQRSQKMLERARSERQFRKIQTASKRASSMSRRSDTALLTHRGMNNFLEEQKQKVNSNLKGSSYKKQMQTRPQSSILFLSTTKKLIDQSKLYEQKAQKKFATTAPTSECGKFNVNFLDWNPKGFTVNHLNWNPTKSQNSYKTKLQQFQSYINQQ